MPYQVQSGTRLRAIKPEVLGNELDRIKAEEGKLTTRGVVDAARPEVAPLHPEFVWDGEQAIEELNEIYARRFIRAVVWVDPPTKKNPDPLPTRVWVNVPAESGKGPGVYERIQAVVKVEDTYQRAFEALNQRVTSALTALDELKSAAKLAPNSERLRQFTLAEEAFRTVQEAIRILGQSKATA